MLAGLREPEIKNQREAPEERKGHDMPLQMQRNDRPAAGALTVNRSNKPSKEVSPIGTPN